MLLFVRGNSHTRVNIWKFSVEGLQSCGPQRTWHGWSSVTEDATVAVTSIPAAVHSTALKRSRDSDVYLLVLPRRTQPLAQTGITETSCAWYVSLTVGNVNTCFPLVRKTLSVFATFPIVYAICMRNHSIIIGNVVVRERFRSTISWHNFINLSNIPNIYGICMEEHTFSKMAN